MRKVYQVVSGRPIGPWPLVFLEKPPAGVFDSVEEDDPYGTWVEETTFENIAKHLDFVSGIRKNFPLYELEIWNTWEDYEEHRVANLEYP